MGNWLKQPGECCDKNGIPIYPGDLLKTFHFTGPRRRKYYLYHVAVYDDSAGGMRILPTKWLEPTAPRDGGNPLLSDDMAASTEVVAGQSVGDAVLFTERRAQEKNSVAGEVVHQVVRINGQQICPEHVTNTDLAIEIERLRGEVQRLTDDLADQVHQRAVYQALVEGVEIPPTCAVCGKPATCIGWSSDAGVLAACDDCCGHGNEDSWCEMVLPTRHAVEKLERRFDELQQNGPQNQAGRLI